MPSALPRRQFLALAATPLLATPADPTFPPIDESRSDPTFLAFRNRLLRIIRRRDYKTLLSITPENFRNDSDGTDDRAEFNTYWNPARPTSNSTWLELEKVIRLGCARISETKFIAPYISAGIHEPELPYEDIFERSYIIHPKAKLYAAPNERSRLIKTLNFNYVEVLTQNLGPWSHIRTVSGFEGYVLTAHIRSTLDKAAIFVREQSTWRFTMFVPGD